MERWRTGTRGFGVLIAGQGLSLTGATMASLGLSVWLWQATGAAAAMSTATVCFLVPQALASPVAGMVVDRSGPRAALLAAAAGTAGASAAALGLVSAGALTPPALYALNLLAGGFASLEMPAFAAAMGRLTSGEGLDRASALLGLARNAANVLAPALAGGLLVAIGLGGVLSIAIASAGAAVAAVLTVRLGRRPPAAPHTGSTGAQHGPGEPPAGATPPDGQPAGLWPPAAGGLDAPATLRQAMRLLAGARSLRHLLVVQLAVAMAGAVGSVFMAPLVLARTGSDVVMLGTVLAAAGAGGVAGGVIMATLGARLIARWGRVRLALASAALVSALGFGGLGSARSGPFLAGAAFALTFWLALYGAPVQALWVQLVPPEAHGRVIALQQLLVRSATPLAMLAAGPLADALGAVLTAGREGPAAWTARLVGAGPAGGMALLLLASAMVGLAAAALGWSSRALRSAGGARATQRGDAAGAR